MRSILAALFLLTACSEKIERTLPLQPQKKSDFQKTLQVVSEANEIFTSQMLSERYSESAEAFYALLWPREFRKEQQETLVQALQTARSLQTIRTQYATESNRLKLKNKENQCDCVLVGICETEIDAETSEQYTKNCQLIEADQIDNDLKLTQIMKLQTDLKSQIHKIGGYWLDVPDNDLLQFSFLRNEINFKNAVMKNKSGSSLDLSESYWALTGQPIDGALRIQGELRVVVGTVIYRGEIGFQLSEKFY